MKVRINRHGSYSPADVVLYQTEHPDAVATLAMDFLKQWGLVAAIPDGETSAGHNKLRLPTTAELVGRAFDIAESAIAVARERGHVVAVPDLNEINKEYDAKQVAKEESARA